MLTYCEYLLVIFLLILKYIIVKLLKSIISITFFILKKIWAKKKNTFKRQSILSTSPISQGVWAHLFNILKLSFPKLSSFILDWCACLFFLDIGTNDHASIFTVYSYAIFKFGSKEMTCYSEKLFQITKIIKCVFYRRQIIFSCKKPSHFILLKHGVGVVLMSLSKVDLQTNKVTLDFSNKNGIQYM